MGYNDAYETRWPKDGDRLFGKHRSWHRAVNFPINREIRRVSIWYGYMNAGDALIAACTEDPSLRDILIYPILFNYRHGIEIAMKVINSEYGRYSTVDVSDLSGHDLTKSWSICKEIITEVESNEHIRPVERILEDFDQIDKSAQTFRYPEDMRGNFIELPEEYFDLQNIRDVMQGVFNYFDAVYSQLDDYCSGMEQ